MGWNIYNIANDYQLALRKGLVSCAKLIKDLNLIDEIQKAVIEKVGSGNYGRIVEDITCRDWVDDGVDFDVDDVYGAIATASARQRLEACLLALGVEDLESQK